MQLLGTYKSATFGTVRVLRGHYGNATGPLAIALEMEDGEPLAVLSVNMYRPQCSHDSRALPPGCFYVKGYSENAPLIPELLASGLFKERPDLPEASSGFITAPAWEIAEPRLAG